MKPVNVVVAVDLLDVPLGLGIVDGLQQGVDIVHRLQQKKSHVENGIFWTVRFCKRSTSKSLLHDCECLEDGYLPAMFNMRMIPRLGNSIIKRIG